MRWLLLLLSLCGVALTAAAERHAGGEAGPPVPRSGVCFYEVRRTEDTRSELNRRFVQYKGRGSGETELQVGLEARGDGPALRLRVLVSRLVRKSETPEGTRESRLDAHGFSEWLAKRPMHSLRPDGAPNEREELGDLSRTPWAELAWDGRAWSQAACTARGGAWPVADALALERELVLLLPALPAELASGRTFEQAVVLPYPVPLRPVLTAVVRYRVRDVAREDGRRVASIAFSGVARESAQSGAHWGGMRLAGLHGEATLEGTLRAEVDGGKLRQARWRLESVVRSGPEAGFSSRWGMESSWKLVRR